MRSSHSQSIIEALWNHEKLLECERRRRLEASTKIEHTAFNEDTDDNKPQERCAMAAAFWSAAYALRCFSWRVSWWDEDDRVLSVCPKKHEETRSALPPRTPLARRSCPSLLNLDGSLVPDHPRPRE